MMMKKIDYNKNITLFTILKKINVIIFYNDL